MSHVLELPVDLANAPFDPVGKTVGSVVRQVELALRKTEIEPEWVTVANHFADANEARYGLKPDSGWPEVGGRQQRLSLSVERGMSEGWIVQVDYVRFHEADEGGHWTSQPLITIKTLSRPQGWAIAAVVSRLLDID
ncbi:hypothetical protein [Burkholderia vietnamiensis]|uniref:hypothetical protein n=1 Tax=Burkholderia vietnamiensis TaxID=60552 RepID=UPI00075F6C1B|nr:hypothetical protein [Burkholderia vietnamiensis]KVE17611.1 hypothetical protein WI92_04585 [Burkholderia vietnamiensis]CAG9226002.1 conserved hypothetical protein [Burkholderia vietnamiensis]